MTPRHHGPNRKGNPYEPGDDRSSRAADAGRRTDRAADDGRSLGAAGPVPLERIWLHPAPGTATVDDVIRVDEHENRLCELVDGTLVEKPMGAEESNVAWVIGSFIFAYLVQNDLGTCLGPDGFLRISTGLVRAPDLSFVSWAKLPRRKLPRKKVPHLIPDLAIEILSKSNTPAEIRCKLGEYFDSGVRLAWVIDPREADGQDPQIRAPVQP